MTDGQRAAEMISDFCNCNDKKSKQDFLRTLQEDHRYLQSLEIEFFLQVLKMYSQVGTDGRNEYHVKTLQKIMPIIEKEFGI
jgi:hypothetical protein